MRRYSDINFTDKNVVLRLVQTRYIRTSLSIQSYEKNKKKY